MCPFSLGVLVSTEARHTHNLKGVLEANLPVENVDVGKVSSEVVQYVSPEERKIDNYLLKKTPYRS